MTDKVREQISALLDDELPEAEAELLFQRLSGDATLRRAWGDYCLTGEVLRGNHGDVPAHSLADRVMDAIELEVLEEAPRRRARARAAWLKPVAGLAVAASVAMVAVLALQQDHHVAGGQQALTAGVTTPPTLNPTEAAIPVSYTTRPGVRWDHGERAVQNHLNSYLVNHNEYTAAMRRQGMLPYLHIAAYEAQPEPQAEARK
ncbi:MAG: sigma-E factor negative regulatory protein [Gammaproteobacteria bacterium]|jgi:sigma-E factor negative regulatory protein RseA